jgi:hypothetical protein
MCDHLGELPLKVLDLTGQVEDFEAAGGVLQDGRGRPDLDTGVAAAQVLVQGQGGLQRELLQPGHGVLDDRPPRLAVQV